MTQVMMTQDAHRRVADRLAARHPHLDIVILQPSGELTRADGRADADVDPEIFWASLDAFESGTLPAFFRQLLTGTRGQWLQTFNAGLDNPIFRSVMAKGLRITKNDAQSIAIAEYVLAHAFARLHPIAEQRAAQTRRAWEKTPFREIGATRWTLVGYGAIARAIAERLRPFGAHITAVRRHVEPDPRVDAVIAPADLASVLPQTDVVVLACALNDSTRDLVDATFLAALKPGALLINIGRGELVDEDALKSALDRGTLAHAVLDVAREEPPAQDSWLWAHPSVTLTAHTSNTGSGVLARGDALFLDNLDRYLAGERLRNEAERSEVGL